MLSAPTIRAIAIASEDWKAIPPHASLGEASGDDPEVTEVEIWTYDPKLSAEEDIVDRFSLFVSLKDNEDERVEQALQEMIETAPW